MKRLLSLLTILILLCLSAVPARAAGSAANTTQDIQVGITSPSAINSVPIHNDTIEITVTNKGQSTYSNLSCYLTIVDVGRNQTYPVDEFGENAYQTRTIDSLAPGMSAVISIPVHIIYVGEFRFTASVINYETNQIFTANALNVIMTATSNMNKSLVMIVSACVPAVLATAVFMLTRKKEKARE